MNPNQKGWLKRFLDFRDSVDTRYELMKLHPGVMSPDRIEESLYRILQPTGLIYGHPVQLPYIEHPESHEWTPTGKMGVILVESIINSVILPVLPGLSSQEIREVAHEGVIRTQDYYREVYPEIVSSRSIFSYKKDDLHQAERMIASRLMYKISPRNYWKTFFHNSLLFLDVYYFGQWFHDKPQHLALNEVRERKNPLRYKILEVVASAAHADDKVVEEEKELFHHFLDSAHLPKNLRADTKLLIQNPTQLENLDLSSIDAWIIRKYVLELAILTIWADRVVNAPELRFVTELSRKLGLEDQELESSMISMESFVLGHWEDIHFLQGKHDIVLVRNQLTKRLGKLVLKNKDRLAQEIRESKELVQLLNKSRTAPLTDIERVKVRERLIDILKVIPTVVIIALPFTFITLPIMLKLLPRSAFPSAFQD